MTSPGQITYVLVTLVLVLNDINVDQVDLLC